MDENRTPNDFSATQVPPIDNPELLIKPSLDPDTNGFDKYDQKYEDSLSIFTESDDGNSDKTDSSDEMDA